MGCDMCGTENVQFLCDVEGVEMQLCDSCKMYGEVKKVIPTAKELELEEKRLAHEAERAAAQERVRPAVVSPRGGRANASLDAVEMPVADFGQRIKNARESMGLKQEELAKRLAIKESKFHKYETGSFVPTMEMIRKLEQALRIKLTERYVEQKQAGERTDSGPMTIADMLKR